MDFGILANPHPLLVFTLIAFVTHASFASKFIITPHVCYVGVKLLKGLSEGYARRLKCAVESQQNECGEYIPHVPVLAEESVNMLITNHKGCYLDVTLGYGGHSERILESLDGNGALVAIDRDPEAIYHTRKRLEEMYDPKRMSFCIGNFGDLENLLKDNNLPSTNYSGIIADLGVSTHQLEHAPRGFSYTNDALLDMRMASPWHDPLVPPKDVKYEQELRKNNTAYRVGFLVV